MYLPQEVLHPKISMKKINNIPVVFINRGGKITFHGPGQLIIYPILNIKKRKLNIIEYINIIEEIIIKVFKNNKLNYLQKKKQIEVFGQR